MVGAAQSVIDSGHFVLGPWVDRFERSFAAYCGVSQCVGVGNGTDALELGLRALGVQTGERVVVAANAAMYATTAVLAVDAEPWFVDVDPVTGLVTAETLVDALKALPSPPAAIVLTHLYGRLAATQTLIAAARARNIRILEDCAQAHGAMDFRCRRAGSFGDLAAFSFYPTKNLGALGDGGAVVTDNAELAQRMRQLRQYGWSDKYTNSLAGGRNSRLDELQAAFLCQLLPLLDERNTRRRAIANRYSRELRHPDIHVPPPAGEEYVAHLYVVQSPRRDALRAYLDACGVGSDVHYPVPDHRQPLHAERYARISLPATDSMARRVLSIPCFPELSDEEVERVISVCNAWSGA
jgi:dTDP-4-amino-4,6-dideoxygalactose transaminase